MKTSLFIAGTTAVLLTAGCASITSSDGTPKKGVHHFSIANALSSVKAQEVLDSGISTQFASGGGRIIRRGLVSNKKTNAVNKTAEAACQIAFLSAVKQFQYAARNNGGSRVVNLISYYKKRPYSSTTQYECHVGAIMAGVTLKGDIAQ